MNRILIGTFSLLILFLAACSPSSSSDMKENEFIVYTSIYPLYYIVEQISGDSATVKTVYPPGVDAHTYEPSSKEMIDIAKADAFIYLGAGMESFAETIKNTLQSEDVQFLEIGEYTSLFSKDHEEHKVEDHHHEHGDLDPHIWLDPLRMIDMGKIIKEKLIEINPKNESLYETNFASFEKNMRELDQAYSEKLASKTDKHVMVAHAAYGYWEERYGINQIPISGAIAGDEPSQKELTALVKVAKQHNIEFVIFEQNTSDRVSSIIQQHIGAKELQIHNLEVLTDEDIENEEDYMSLMKRNLDVLDKATK